MTKCSIINFEKFKNINDVKNDSNKSIPKIPTKGRHHKSETINIKLINKISKFNNTNLKFKKDFMIINNNNYKNEKNDLKGLNIKVNKTIIIRK